LRKWAFLYAAAAVAVIGCGGTGGGGSHSSTGGGGGGTVNTGIGVKLTNSSNTPPGAIEVAYLTGQGRAAGDLIAVVKHLVFNDSYGTIQTKLAPETDCPLVGFQDNVIHLDADWSTTPGVPSRLFTAFNLDFLRFDQETSTPGVVNSFAEPAGFPKAYPASIRVFPGRTTSVPIYIDDSMFTLDSTNPSGPAIVYTESQFQLSNGATNASPIKGFLSDFVGFNLNNVAAADKTSLGTQAGFGGSADHVFFSGDVYALSSGHASGSTFAALTTDPTIQINGLLGAAGTLNGPGGTLPHAGTYSLLQLNPTDITQTMKIVASQGIWREHTTVLTNLSSSKVNVLTFPSSNDDNMQEMVAWTQDANGNVSNLYYGFADLDAMTFNLYPLVNIVAGSTTDGSGNANGISGTISSLYTRTGASTASPDLTRSGVFTVTTVPGSAAYPQPPAALANGTTGKFYVFRL